MAEAPPPPPPGREDQNKKIVVKPPRRTCDICQERHGFIEIAACRRHKFCKKCLNDLPVDNETEECRCPCCSDKSEIEYQLGGTESGYFTRSEADTDIPRTRSWVERSGQPRGPPLPLPVPHIDQAEAADQADGAMVAEDRSLPLLPYYDYSDAPLPNIVEGYGEEVDNFNAPTNLAYDHVTERVFVTDVRNHRVKVYSQDGHFITSFGGRGPNPGQFFMPWTMAVLHLDGRFDEDMLAQQEFPDQALSVEVATPDTEDISGDGVALGDSLIGSPWVEKRSGDGDFKTASLTSACNNIQPQQPPDNESVHTVQSPVEQSMNRSWSVASHLSQADWNDLLYGEQRIKSLIIVANGQSDDFGPLGEGKVQILTTDGEFIDRIGWGELNIPTGIYCHRGLIYICDRDRIVVFSVRYASARTVIRNSAFVSLWGIHIVDDRLFVTDRSAEKVFICNLNGDVLRELSCGDRTGPPLGITLDPVGYILVTYMQDIVVYRPNYNHFCDIPNNSEITHLHDVEVLPERGIVVVGYHGLIFYIFTTTERRPEPVSETSADDLEVEATISDPLKPYGESRGVLGLQHPQLEGVAPENQSLSSETDEAIRHLDGLHPNHLTIGVQYHQTVPDAPENPSASNNTEAATCHVDDLHQNCRTTTDERDQHEENERKHSENE